MVSKAKTLTKKIIEMLVKHLLEIEEVKSQLLDKYYPDITKEREEFMYLMDNYVNKIKEYIYRTETTDTENGECPFVIIGSIVELENLDDNNFEKYHIVSPFEITSNSNVELASFLSPVGKELLLKRIGDVITIKNPMGQLTYAIKSIDIPDQLLSGKKEII